MGLTLFNGMGSIVNKHKYSHATYIPIAVQQ